MDPIAYDPALDDARLNRQCKKVLGFMIRLAGQWATLREISAGTGEPEASISARLRELANKYGYLKTKRRRGDERRGIWEYRILKPFYSRDEQADLFDAKLIKRGGKMRLMSFRLTPKQILEMTKTVTRRRGWAFAYPGMRVRAVIKVRGLKKGEALEELAIIEFIDVRREKLSAILEQGKEEIEREGFPEKTPEEFVSMFCENMHCTPEDWVIRIEFRYVRALA